MKKQNNIPKVFFGFLIVSFLMWVLINLSKKSKTIITYNIEYVGLAQNKILQQNPVKKIQLLVRGSGFKLLSTNFSNKKIQLFANKLSRKSANDYYFLTSNQRANIQGQLPTGLFLENIIKDTIHLKLGSLKSKKVPVFANLDINYKLGYGMANKVNITPDSILISAPELQLNKIEKVMLKKVALQNVSNDIKLKLPIILPKEGKKINVNYTTAELEIKVNKFTEGEFEIPVTIKNMTQGKKLNIFPKKVKVIFKIGLKDFNKITAESFEVVCDYQETKKNELTYLIPKLKSKPAKATSIRIVPNKIDFLIYK